MRRLLAAAYVVYLVALARLTLSSGQDAPSAALEALLDVLAIIGIEPSDRQTEAGANVLLFVPLSLLGWFLFRRRSVVFWLLAGAAVSVAIELAQLGIAGRFSTAQDVATNTLGAGIGALLALGWASWGTRDRHVV